MAIPRLAIIGMGGFAGAHHDAVLKLEEKRLARLIATCDPRRAAFVAQRDAWRFAQRGIRVYDDFESMLSACAGEIDGVLIPTPVHLHAAMHAAVARRGLTCFIEKPATLDPSELEAMIEADRQAARPSAVGFNGIADSLRRNLKARLLSGEFGPLQEARLEGFWPRPVPYFQRAPWSGQLVYDGALVLDSCFGNAMAHAVHALLFSAGIRGMDTWATPQAVQAELYRVNAAPAADTAFMQVATVEGPRLRLVLSHACHGHSGITETYVCANATLKWKAGQPVEVTTPDGRSQKINGEWLDPLAENLQQFIQYLNGEIPRPATTLGDTRSFTHLNGLAYVSSSGVTPLREPEVERVRDPREQLDYLTLQGLTTFAERFLLGGDWPGKALGARTGSPILATINDLGRIKSVIDR